MKCLLIILEHQYFCLLIHKLYFASSPISSHKLFTFRLIQNFFPNYTTYSTVIKCKKETTSVQFYKKNLVFLESCKKNDEILVVLFAISKHNRLLYL